MKTAKKLYGQITTFENLLLASRKARKGKRFKKSAARFEEQLENELLLLQKELINKTYEPGTYKSFFIYEPKKRMINTAPYRDRVVHHALCNVIEPVFEKSFIFDSYANRKNKGTHKAIMRYQHFARKYKYVLKADIKKYFPSIDHEILKKVIRRKISCSDTLRLIDMIIDNSNKQEAVCDLFPGDDLFTAVERKKGIPIGNLTSQFFANIYLNPFDHYIKETLGCKAYIRYVDDFVIFGNDKNELWQVLEKCRKFLAQFRLVLHPKKSEIMTTRDGVGFLGHRVFPGFRLLKKQNIKRFKRRFRKNWILFSKGNMSEKDFILRFNSWQGHACFAKTWKLRSKLVRFLTNRGISSKMAYSGAARGTITRGTAVFPTAIHPVGYFKNYFRSDCNKIYPTGQATLTTGTTTTVSVWPSTIQSPN
jgi:retron-type reverse transcriptase